MQRCDFCLSFCCSLFIFLFIFFYFLPILKSCAAVTTINLVPRLAEFPHQSFGKFGSSRKNTCLNIFPFIQRGTSFWGTSFTASLTKVYRRWRCLPGIACSTLRSSSSLPRSSLGGYAASTSRNIRNSCPTTGADISSINNNMSVLFFLASVALLWIPFYSFRAFVAQFLCCTTLQ